MNLTDEQKEIIKGSVNNFEENFLRIKKDFFIWDMKKMIVKI